MTMLHAPGVPPRARTRDNASRAPNASTTGPAAIWRPKVSANLPMSTQDRNVPRQSRMAPIPTTTTTGSRLISADVEAHHWEAWDCPLAPVDPTVAPHDPQKPLPSGTSAPHLPHFNVATSFPPLYTTSVQSAPRLQTYPDFRTHTTELYDSVSIGKDHAYSTRLRRLVVEASNGRPPASRRI